MDSILIAIINSVLIFTIEHGNIKTRSVENVTPRKERGAVTLSTPNYNRKTVQVGDRTPTNKAVVADEGNVVTPNSKRSEDREKDVGGASGVSLGTGGRARGAA